jgi:methionine synthase I (cobalamin-dependent)
MSQHPLEKLIQERIVIIDGAMGTTIRTYGMKEADIRGRGQQRQHGLRRLVRAQDPRCVSGAEASHHLPSRIWR